MAANKLTEYYPALAFDVIDIEQKTPSRSFHLEIEILRFLYVYIN